MTTDTQPGVAGLSNTELKKLSDSVGYDLSRFASKPLPSDAFAKLPLFLWSVGVLSMPFAMAKFGRGEDFLYACGGVMVANAALLEYVRHDIYALRKEWEKSVGAVRASTGEKACEATHSTIQSFRRLIDWEYSTRYLTIPFVVLYVGLISYTLYCALPVFAKILGYDPNLVVLHTAMLPVAFKDSIAILAFLYYWTAFGLRQWIVQRILSYTEGIDPSLQICAAVAEIYKRFEDTSVGRRLTTITPKLAA